MRSADRAFRALPIVLCDAAVLLFSFGISQGKPSCVPKHFVYQKSFPSSRVATVLSLECSNTAVVGSFLESFPGVLVLRLTTERATGEYRGYGRACADNGEMMNVSLRKVQGRARDQPAGEMPTRETAQD